MLSHPTTQNQSIKNIEVFQTMWIKIKVQNSVAKIEIN